MAGGCGEPTRAGTTSQQIQVLQVTCVPRLSGTLCMRVTRSFRIGRIKVDGDIGRYPWEVSQIPHEPGYA